MIVNRTELVVGRILLIAVLVLTLLPFASMLTAALQSPDSLPNGFSWPTPAYWENFVTAFTVGNIGTLMLSSLFIVVMVVPSASSARRSRATRSGTSGCPAGSTCSSP